MCELYCLITNIFIYSVDLSKHKLATQSTTNAGTTDQAFQYVARNAVDRNITTCMRTEIIGKNSLKETVWWKVDLGKVYSIHSVNILFKNYHDLGMY